MEQLARILLSIPPFLLMFFRGITEDGIAAFVVSIVEKLHTCGRPLKAETNKAFVSSA